MTTVRSPFDLTLRFNKNSVRAEGKRKSLPVTEAIKQNKIGVGAGKTQIFKAVAGDFKVKTLPTQVFLHTSPVIPNANLVNVRHISSNSKCRSGKRSSINKILVFEKNVNKSSRHSSSRKDKSLLSKLAKVDFKPRYSVSGKGLNYTIHQDTFSTKNSNFYKNEQEANCSREISTCSRAVFEQLILVGKKDGGYRPII